MYGTVTGWITYAALRGRVVEDTALSAQALVRASDYVRTRYVLRLSPALTENTPEVIEAAYIAAGYELDTPGFWSKTFTGTQTKVLTKVGDIQWTPVNSGQAMGADMHLPTSPSIDALFFGVQIANTGPRLA